MSSHPRKILRMPPDSFTSALGELDPASRALLDLSLRRGMRTEEIAEVLGAEPWNVAMSRDAALRRVAVSVGMEGDENLDAVRARLAELPAEDWLAPVNANGGAGAEGEPAAEPAPEAAAEPEPAAAAEPEPEEERRSRLPILLGLLVVAVVVAVIVATRGGSGGGDQASAPAPAQPAPSGQQPPQPAKKPNKPKKAKPKPAPIAHLRAVRGSGASGTARIAKDGRRLDLRVSGLPNPAPDHYTVWVYDSLVDARQLGQARSGSFELKAKLPANWTRYHFVDVSRESADRNRSHSGRSVARVATSALQP
ncbi:MAG: hypothetical protein QOG63_1129 [Thermoleophilaceae bacterium]|nr:hypothetical protein [Thermoleophilaceae bacterium]